MTIPAVVDASCGVEKAGLIETSEMSAQLLEGVETTNEAKDSTSTLVRSGRSSTENTTAGNSCEDLQSKGNVDQEKAFKEDPTSDLPVDLITVPPKHGNKLTRYLEHNFFSYYRKIFVVIFFANISALIAFTVENNGTPLLTEIGAATSANLMVALLFRQENFVNLVYEICTCVPHSFPLWIRRRLAKVFHYGGCHSGCGTAAIFWYILYTITATRDYVLSPSRAQLANVSTSYILVLMFIFILGGAHPKFRVRYHDYFEVVHRFAGWVALVTFWVHTIFAASVAAHDANTTIGLILVASPNFWFICISTSCTILSWSRLRQHDVYPEFLSSHAIRLHFKYKNMPPFYGLKVSTNPALEWHAFATIPNPPPPKPLGAGAAGDRPGFSIVVSNAGDWTSKAISAPPSKLWIRGSPLHGLLYTSLLFKHVVLIATGSGIGPCLSLLYANRTPRRIFWSASHPESTYGDGIVQAVKKADEKCVIWDTKKKGRPDIVREVWKLVAESRESAGKEGGGAEAVFIISNPKVTRKVVYGMESRGVAAYGAIFDS
ncbi:MAG: hypothetical protein MMC33_007050 [Icmadophila ericetorum]|nr:hypothetical protein [Icmadophila ericetorum]